MRAAAVAAAVALLVAAGCGDATEVREPDLVARGGSGAEVDPGQRVRAEGQRLRISVVTHGQASSTFWAIVRNGIEAAARQSDVTISYRSPDVYSIERMRRLINDAVDSRPDGLVVSIPSPELAAPIRRAVDSGIPVVSINSGSDLYARLGALAHVGQPEEKAGFAAGRRLADSGVRRALCVNQEVGNEGLDERCAGFARALRRAGGRSRVLAVDTKQFEATRRRLAAAIAEDRSDGVLTLNSSGGEAALAVVPPRSGVRLGTFDMSPIILEAVKDGRMLFAVDQQPYLQGYLPVIFLVERARYGLFPAQGDVVPTGPSFVTRETADQAERMSRRGIR